MNVHTIKYWIYFATCLLLANGCKEDLSYREPTGGDSTPPSFVEEIVVTNKPGKAVIHYKAPADQNFLYAKAVYTLKSGKSYEVKSSYFSDSLVVEGFADTSEHDVTLYSVSRREVLSEPIIIKVKPLKAPIWFVLETLKVSNAFGGYKLTAINKTKASVGILVLEKNVFGEWEVNNDQSIYTTTDSINSKISGLDTLDHAYAFAIRDRWLNITDTVFQNIKPIYEVELSNTKFSTFPLPGDPVQQPGAAVQYMWDNKLGSWPVSFTSLATATLNTPSTVTFDMGAPAKLSKFWIRPFKELSNLYYSFTTLKRFEVWGSTNPNLNGSLDASWIKLGYYVLKKPSGPGATETAEDQAAAAAGFFFETDINAPKVRYLRIRCLENYGGSCPQSVDEIKVYGDPRK